jgi:hypothetical protein
LPFPDHFTQDCEDAMHKINWKADYTLFLYLILLPIYFLLHGYNAFFGLLSFNILLSLFLSYLTIATILFLGTTLLFRNMQKAFLFSLFLLFVFFFFGAIHDGLKALLNNSRLTSYSFLLPCLLILSGVVFYYIKKQRNGSRSFLRFVKWLLSFFVVWEVVLLLHASISGKDALNNLALPASINTTGTRYSKPDIFFIVFDEYPSSKSLQTHFNYNNESLDTLLQAADFFTSYESKSNYNFTSYSLASTLNFNYLRVANNTVLHEKQLLQSVETVKRNGLTRFLESMGYDIINFGTYELEQDPVKTTAYFDDSYIKLVIDGQTMWSRVKKDIWWNFTMKKLVPGEIRVPDSFREQKHMEIHRNQYNFQHTVGQITVETDKPKFVFTHLLLPHAPYYVNAKGEPKADSIFIKKQFNDEEAFLDQVQYANLLIKTLVEEIKSKKTVRPRVYIIESDHGYRYFKQEKDGERAFMNLNAIFFQTETILSFTME